MPTISTFFGIAILMYFDDHAPPHFHAKYQGNKAIIAIATGEVVEGKLPRTAMRFVEEWRQLHIAELNSAWQLAKSYQNPNKIPPLE
jgi:Domain of unknown function (DUF4160)